MNKYNINFDIQTNNKYFIEHQIKKYFDGKNILINEIKIMNEKMSIEYLLENIEIIGIRIAITRNTLEEKEIKLYCNFIKDKNKLIYYIYYPKMGIDITEFEYGKLEYRKEYGWDTCVYEDKKYWNIHISSNEMKRVYDKYIDLKLKYGTI